MHTLSLFRHPPSLATVLTRCRPASTSFSSFLFADCSVLSANKHLCPPSLFCKGCMPCLYHTSKLCSANAFPPCFFCARKPSGTLIICSNCGFLSHQACLCLFLMEVDNSSLFSEHCPKCGRLSARLASNFVNGHRNFSSVLRHQGYATLLPTHQSVGVQRTHHAHHAHHAHQPQRRHRSANTNDNDSLISDLLLNELTANSADNQSSNQLPLRDV